VIGAVASLACYGAVAVLKPRLGYDDSLDVFGVHGIGGTWGAIATGIFASSAINPAGADGLVAGDPTLVAKQALAVLACAGAAGLATLVILKAISLVVPLRVSDAEESAGLDPVVHGEAAFDFFETHEPVPAHARAADAPALLAPSLVEEALAEA
jgi:Amt family ammonium transporter